MSLHRMAIEGCLHSSYLGWTELEVKVAPGGKLYWNNFFAAPKNAYLM